MDEIETKLIPLCVREQLNSEEDEYWREKYQSSDSRLVLGRSFIGSEIILYCGSIMHIATIRNTTFLEEFCATISHEIGHQLINEEHPDLSPYSEDWALDKMDEWYYG